MRSSPGVSPREIWRWLAANIQASSGPNLFVVNENFPSDSDHLWTWAPLIMISTVLGRQMPKALDMQILQGDMFIFPSYVMVCHFPFAFL